MRTILCGLLALLLSWAMPTLADVPATVGYNGMLFDCTADDAACEGYSYDGAMTFSLWKDASSTAPADLVWEEVHPKIRPSGGYYHVELGSRTAFTANAFTGARWLEVQLGNDAPLAPRAPVGSVPFALSSARVQGRDLAAELDALKAEVAQLRAALVAGERVCPSNMKPVGDFCVDQYEASLWARKDGERVDCAALQTAVKQAVDAHWDAADIYYGYQGRSECTVTNPAMQICHYRQFGSRPSSCTDLSTCGDYDEFLDGTTAAFPKHGNWTKPLFACAIEGVMPSHSMTWFQAQQACAASGKHMITNGEWQAAVAGTLDPGANNGWHNGRCNTYAGSLGVRPTGSAGGAGPRSSEDRCVSRYGVEDMIGNLWEWVDLWGQAGKVSADFDPTKPPSVWPSTYGDGDDRSANVNGEAFGPKPDGSLDWVAGLPFAAFRGGRWVGQSGAGAFDFQAQYGPSYWDAGVGLRCARGL